MKSRSSNPAIIPINQFPFCHFPTDSSVSPSLFPSPTTNLRNSDGRKLVFFLLYSIKIHHCLFHPFPALHSAQKQGKVARVKVLRIMTLASWPSSTESPSSWLGNRKGVSMLITLGFLRSLTCVSVQSTAHASSPLILL